MRAAKFLAWHAFGEYLLLRPRNEGVEYAVPINGPIKAARSLSKSDLRRWSIRSSSPDSASASSGS